MMISLHCIESDVFVTQTTRIMFRDIILQQDEKFQNVSPVVKSTLLL